MGGLVVSAGVIETLMGQWNVAAGQSGQQCLNRGGTLPGKDAGGPVDTTQRINDGRHCVWVVRAVDHQHSQVVAQGAAGAGSATVEIALGPTASAGEVSWDLGARPADWPPVAVEGQAGKHAVMTTAGTRSAGAHRGVKAAVTQILARPRRSALVGHAVASTASVVPVGDQWAAPLG